MFNYKIVVDPFQTANGSEKINGKNGLGLPVGLQFPFVIEPDEYKHCPRDTQSHRKRKPDICNLCRPPVDEVDAQSRSERCVEHVNAESYPAVENVVCPGVAIADVEIF